MGTVVRLAAAGLLGSALIRASASHLEGIDVGVLALVLGGGLGVLLFVLSRWQPSRTPPARAPVRAAAPVDAPPVPPESPADSRLAEGVRDIRRTDPGFDPGRFVGYAGMMFRDALRAWVAGDIGSLRDRVTPEMHAELQAQYARSRSARRATRVEEMEITAEVTEAWQESGRDYVTAYISGSLVDYTVDEVSDRLLDGSRTIPRGVGEFWTFTRPRGLHFWMLSAIETS